MLFVATKIIQMSHIVAHCPYKILKERAEWNKKSRPEVVLEKSREGDLIEGLFWMYTISIFLFWVPVLGGLAAGVVGGYVVGRVKGALKISIVPAVIFSVVLTILALTFQGQWLSWGYPFLSPAILAAFYVVFLMIGSFLGGLHRQLHVA